MTGRAEIIPAGLDETANNINGVSGKAAISIGTFYTLYPTDVNTPDFQSFITKLPEAAMEKIKFDSFAFFRQAVQAANLTLKMEQSQAYGILSALLILNHGVQ